MTRNPFHPLPPAQGMVLLTVWWQPLRHRGKGYAQMPIGLELLDDTHMHGLLVEQSVSSMHRAAQELLPGHMDLLRYAPLLRFADDARWERFGPRNDWRGDIELVWKKGAGLAKKELHEAGRDMEARLKR